MDQKIYNIKDQIQSRSNPRSRVKRRFGRYPKFQVMKKIRFGGFYKYQKYIRVKGN